MRLFFFTAAITLLFAPRINAETRVDSYFRYLPSRKADAMAGKVKILEAGSGYSRDTKVFNKLPLVFSLENKYIGIENSTAVELPAHLVKLAADLETTLPFFKASNTYIRFGISPSFYGDDWDFSSSSFRLPLRAFIIYQASPKWTYICGIALYPEFQHEVLPILGFIYKPSEKLTFDITPRRPNITYSFNDRTALFLEGGSSFDEYEVTKDNLKNVVLRYREIRLAAGIDHKFNKFIRGYVSLGASFNRYLSYKDSLGKVGIENGLYTQARLEIKF